MTIKEIVKAYLKANGFDGLYNAAMPGDGCGCTIDDLMPCDEQLSQDCTVGYKVEYPNDEVEYCPCGEVCPWHIEKEK